MKCTPYGLGGVRRRTDSVLSTFRPTSRGVNDSVVADKSGGDKALLACLRRPQPLAASG